MQITSVPVRQARARIDPGSGSIVRAADTPLAVFRVQSESGHTHIVTETANDETEGSGMIRTWSCTCPSYTYRPHRLCEHILAVIAELNPY